MTRANLKNRLDGKILYFGAREQSIHNKFKDAFKKWDKNIDTSKLDEALEHLKAYENSLKEFKEVFEAHVKVEADESEDNNEEQQ